MSTKEYDRGRAFLPHRIALRDSYQGTEAYRVSHNKATAEWRKRNPEKYRAQTAVNNAVRDGRIIKPSQCGCGGPGKVTAHHDDYAKPLEVQWLCHPCHEKAHHGGRTRYDHANQS